MLSIHIQFAEANPGLTILTDVGDVDIDPMSIDLGKVSRSVKEWWMGVLFANMS